MQYFVVIPSSPDELYRISHVDTAKEASEILQTT